MGSRDGAGIHGPNEREIERKLREKREEEQRKKSVEPYTPTASPPHLPPPILVIGWIAWRSPSGRRGGSWEATASRACLDAMRAFWAATETIETSYSVILPWDGTLKSVRRGSRKSGELRTRGSRSTLRSGMT
jgi:hypothetical protein